MPQHSPLASVSATRDVLARYGLAAKKALGQHFLIDDGIIGRILSLSDIAQEEVVLEVGPGIGTLTVALLRRCKGVVAIERDKNLPAVLAETCAFDSDKLAVICEDALAVGEPVIERAAKSIGGFPTKLIANLPYAVAATIVLDYFERFDALSSATVMVQSEVADRMAAEPGTKDYGAYTIKLRLHARITDRFQVAPACFFPPPRVDSAVIRLDRHEPVYNDEPAAPALLTAAAFAADAAFCQRRKNIRNSMGAYLNSRGQDKALIDAVLVQAGIEPTVRGETLQLSDYLELGRALMDNGVCGPGPHT